VIRRFVLWTLLLFAAALLLAPIAFGQTPGEEAPISDLLMYSALVGFLLPPVLAIVMQSSWSQRAKAVVAFLACLVAGAGTAYFEADLDGRTWISASLVVVTTALATYRNFWKPTGISPAIESATNLGGGGGG
jgi:hypothetical protein